MVGSGENTRGPVFPFHVTSVPHRSIDHCLQWRIQGVQRRGPVIEVETMGTGLRQLVLDLLNGGRVADRPMSRQTRRPTKDVRIL
jgi:hypothetical protein